LQLELGDITLFCQDWGGLIGLRLVAACPEMFAGVVIGNTGLPVGTGMTEGFKAWLDFSQSAPVMPIGFIVNGGTGRNLEPHEVAAYDAPFPDESYKEGARQFPMLVPVSSAHGGVEENKAAWKVLEAFDKPFLTAFSDGDAVTRGGEAEFQKRVPGAKGQPHTILSGGHFLQEDSPLEIAGLIDGMITRRVFA
jgi:haloalkane dehalogenase